MKLKDLIGYKLEKINNNEIVISNDNKLYILKFEEDDGGCCGYNELETTLLIDEKNKPIITNVKYEDVSEEDEWGDSNSEIIKITFFGENKEIANIKSKSSSGSGWRYGACVTVNCKELHIHETISSW